MRDGDDDDAAGDEDDDVDDDEEEDVYLQRYEIGWEKIIFVKE